MKFNHLFSFTKKIVILGAIFILLSSGVLYANGNRQRQDVLTIYTWAGMFPQEILDDFERETGYRVN